VAANPTTIRVVGVPSNLGFFQVDLLVYRMKDVFNRNTITLTPGAAPGTAGNVFLGRPWRGWFSNFRII
jgi:hypothetical protein